MNFLPAERVSSISFALLFALWASVSIVCQVENIPQNFFCFKCSFGKPDTDVELGFIKRVD